MSKEPSKYIDKEGFLDDLDLLLEEAQTKAGYSFSDDVSFGEVLACVEANETCVAVDEQDVRDAFTNGYSLGKEQAEESIVRCRDCKRNADNGGLYPDGRTMCPIQEHYALLLDGYCHLGERISK